MIIIIMIIIMIIIIMIIIIMIIIIIIIIITITCSSVAAVFPSNTSAVDCTRAIASCLWVKVWGLGLGFGGLGFWEDLHVAPQSSVAACERTSAAGKV